MDDDRRRVLGTIPGSSIEDQERARQTPQASELRFRQMVDGIPGLVHTMTAAGEVEFVNQQVLDFTGETLEDLKKDWAPLIHPDDRARVLALWNRSVETGQPFEENTVPAEPMARIAGSTREASRCAIRTAASSAGTTWKSISTSGSEPTNASLRRSTKSVS